MKKFGVLLIVACMLTMSGCALLSGNAAPDTDRETLVQQPPIRGDVVDILLDGQDITVGEERNPENGAVFLSQDIVFYEEKTHYESGNPYGEGTTRDMHTREEAESNLVVNITAPGTYRLSGKLNPGQIRIDLGEKACDDPDAVVVLILDNAQITCTVGPAILFQNVYECDGNWSVESASPEVDTSGAGANLVLAEGSKNTITGSYVAKIYKDKEGEKKLWKQDGAIYSYMSMNVFGPGALELNAENEGLDTELHLTIYGGDLSIRSGNDGINTNEDGVSVTAIRGGNVRIAAGLGEEGDGIDSNGYLVIYGGTVISSAHPAADAGLDSDLGSFIHGGTVVALGSAMDWAESDSGQVTVNLQFAKAQAGDIRIVREDGTEVFSFDPAADTVLGVLDRSYQGAIISCAQFRVGDIYQLFADGLQMAYTGTDVMRHPGGMMPEEDGQRPEGGTPPSGGMPQPPQGDPPAVPEGQMPTGPEGEMPTWPGGENPVPPQGQNPPGGFDNPGQSRGNPDTRFVMQDQVNFFSGLTEEE